MATADWQAIQPRWMGTALKRKEDPRMITGTGRYIDDIAPPGTLHMAVVRSPEAHAAISGIDLSEAREHPNVVAVFTGDDLADDIAGGVMGVAEVHDRIKVRRRT